MNCGESVGRPDSHCPTKCEVLELGRCLTCPESSQTTRAAHLKDVPGPLNKQNSTCPPHKNLFLLRRSWLPYARNDRQSIMCHTRRNPATGNVPPKVVDQPTGETDGVHAAGNAFTRTAHLGGVLCSGQSPLTSSKLSREIALLDHDFWCG